MKEIKLYNIAKIQHWYIEIFEELGYTVEEGNRNIFIYIDDGEYINHSFVIHKESKTITVYKQLVTMQELQAINEKVKELG